MRLIAIAGLMAAFATRSDGQVRSLHLGRDSTVVVRIPPSAFAKAPGFRTWVANVELLDSGVVVNHTPAWRATGFASLAPLRIASLKADPKSGLLRVELDRAHGGSRVQRDRLFVSFPLADTSTIIPRVFSTPADSDDVRADSYTAVGRRVFGVAGDSIPADVQVRILWLADSILQGDSVRMRTFGGRSYLQLALDEQIGERGYDADLDTEAKRLTGALLEVVFPVVTGLAGKAPSLPDGFGFGVTFGVNTSSLIDLLAVGYSDPRREEVTIYVPASAAARFALGDLSGQALLDESVLEVKGKGVVKLVLTR